MKCYKVTSHAPAPRCSEGGGGVAYSMISARCRERRLFSHTLKSAMIGFKTGVNAGESRNRRMKDMEEEEHEERTE